MGKTYILYNPIAGEGNNHTAVDSLTTTYDNAVLTDMCRIADYQTFFSNLEKDADLILCGGDGTLNRFANEIRGLDVKNRIFYFSMGTGNDFARDLGHEKQEAPTYCINRYLTDLPTVTVNGKTQVYLNNVGFGIDGYCCEVGDRLRDENSRKTNPKPINYTAIAIKGLLFHFKPRKATITVDGKTQTFRKVWLAPTMNGRYYGGGMMPAPAQDRTDPRRTQSVMVYHSLGKLRALMLFPSIFKGEHVTHRKNVAILTGNEIHVAFDRPTPLQIDGETVLGVTSYTVSAKVPAKR